MKFSYTIFLLSLSIFSLIFTVKAQNEQSKLWKNEVKYNAWETFRLSEEDSKTLQNKWNEIKESLKTASHPFAGTYLKDGYMRGYFLCWSLEKGFVFVHYFDITAIVDFSYGRVLVNELGVTFVPEREIRSTLFENLKTPAEWIFADNGRYLVKRDDVKLFGDFYAGLGKFNGELRNYANEGATPFPRRIDKGLTYSPKFVLPPKYESFVKEPITGTITRVGKKRLIKSYGTVLSATSVTINIGRMQGVKLGMNFILVSLDRNDYQTLKITRIGKNTSQGLVLRDTDTNGNEAYYDDYDREKDKMIYKSYLPIRVGTKITTSWFNEI